MADTPTPISDSLIDDDFFAKIGLPDTPADSKAAMRDAFESRLQIIIAEKMAPLLDETQYESFKDALATDNPQIILEWLTINCPNFDMIATQARTELIDEVNGLLKNNPAA